MIFFQLLLPSILLLSHSILSVLRTFFLSFYLSIYTVVGAKRARNSENERCNKNRGRKGNRAAGISIYYTNISSIGNKTDIFWERRVEKKKN